MSDPLSSRTQAEYSKMLRGIFGEYLKDNMRTSVPGHVLSFDPDTQMAEVQIGLMLEDRLGAQQPRRPIIHVPVQFWGAAGGTLECRVANNTEGVLFFSQECIDSWVDQGGVAVKSEPRRFSINDAYFIPGVRSIPGAITDFSNDGIRLRSNDGSAYFWIHDNKSLEIGGVSLNVTCPANFEQAVTTMTTIHNQGVNIGKAHTHNGVQSGSGNSGVVNP
ncbi:Gp138 family membrane-puncturing spike protein [Pseudomonas brassicacearum]|uniref:Gp138 family membrane-puncturing spike protein n=1 Tax=Pseudomonas brassicacearum TaxID=930166 RepID=UPI0011CDEF64|nr:Gp138 family membrane-puncturing spike protein [Pseudomonas brassicacearum]